MKKDITLNIRNKPDDVLLIEKDIQIKKPKSE